ncbi:MAG: hypothetical protein AVDCRST_MAG32-2200, partial [uncultured Nocardioides sp.]
ASHPVRPPACAHGAGSHDPRRRARGRRPDHRAGDVWDDARPRDGPRLGRHDLRGQRHLRRRPGHGRPGHRPDVDGPPPGRRRDRRLRGEQAARRPRDLRCEQHGRCHLRQGAHPRRRRVDGVGHRTPRGRHRRRARRRAERRDRPHPAAGLQCRSGARRQGVRRRRVGRWQQRGAAQGRRGRPDRCAQLRDRRARTHDGARPRGGQHRAGPPPPPL